MCLHLHSSLKQAPACQHVPEYKYNSVPSEVPLQRSHCTITSLSAVDRMPRIPRIALSTISAAAADTSATSCTGRPTLNKLSSRTATSFALPRGADGGLPGTAAAGVRPPSDEPPAAPAVLPPSYCSCSTRSSKGAEEIKMCLSVQSMARGTCLAYSGGKGKTGS
jgi:hypothetical protein